MELSGYRFMWVITLFDLPVDTKEARKLYARFRKFLLEGGFSRMQFSVYKRHCSSKENAQVHINRIQRNLPPDGEVRVIAITDKQFERMFIFQGKMRRKAEPAFQQLEFF